VLHALNNNRILGLSVIFWTGRTEDYKIKYPGRLE